MSRRTLLGLLVPVVLLLGWFTVKHFVRRHVDGKITASVDHPLPPFALIDPAGEQWDNERVRGKVVVLHFFRSRCESCEHEAPEYRKLEQLVDPQKVAILSICTDAVLDFPAAETQATIARKGFKHPVLMADRAFVDALHQVAWAHVTPVTYIVDDQGVIRVALRGAQQAEAIAQRVPRRPG
jgi:peroxiredoxin